jgi:cytoplasmic tRNA 2-thiolation protein 1
MAKLCPGYMDDCACKEPAEDIAGCGGGPSAVDDHKEWNKLSTANDQTLSESTVSLPTPQTPLKSGTTRVTVRKMGTCVRCGYISSQEVCQACTLLEGLNKSRPKVNVTNSQITMQMNDLSL